LLDGVVVPEKVLLVDDIVDSRWTLTVCGYRLMEHGCREVYPFALADSSQKDG
jgi:ATP-dependent DNA helicase RecQ